jgi:phosphomevalonate kinase
MLAGEYVVVERGSPALAVAVGRRMIVEIASESRRTWLVTSPGLGLKDAPVKSVPVLAEVLARLPGLPSGGRITVTSELGEGPDKPGLGGSAALCAAAFVGLWKVSGASGPPDLEIAIAAHRAAQGGHGSGFDVATALHGGVALFFPAGEGTAARVEQLVWPAGLHAAVFRTGRGSDTKTMLARMHAWREEDEPSFEACINPLADETMAFIEAFRAADVPRILDAAAQVQEELALMDRIGELGVLGGGQCQILGAIEDSGAIARTAGAGGGDCAWALSDDPEALERAAKACAELGFERLTLELGGEGTRLGDDP